MGQGAEYQMHKLSQEVERLTAENARLSLENQSLREKIIAAGWQPYYPAEDIKNIEGLFREIGKRDRAAAKELEAENERLSAALVECQEAFESGREVGAVVGELAY